MASYYGSNANVTGGSADGGTAALQQFGGSLTVAAGDSYFGGAGAPAGTYGGGGEQVGGDAGKGLEAIGLTSADLYASNFTGGADGVSGAPGAFVHVDGGSLHVRAGGGYYGGDSGGTTFEGGAGAVFSVTGGGAGRIDGPTTFKPGQNAAINYDGIACSLAAKGSSTWDVYGGDFGFTALSQWIALAIETGSSVVFHGSGLVYNSVSRTFTGGTLSDGSTVGGLGVRDYTPGGTLSASGSGATVTFTA